MRVYMATFYRRNYGSALQAFALQHKLMELGCDAVLIEPAPRDVKLIPRMVRFLKPDKHYGLGRKIKLLVQKRKMQVKYSKIDAFVNTHILTEPFMSCYRAIQEGNCILMAGSDQIWSVIHSPVDDFYLFKFAPRNGSVRRFSYAASIGLSALTEAQIDYYKKALADFEVVSFREKVACDILGSKLVGATVRNDVDPTLLFDGKFWGTVAAGQPREKPYIFVYMLRPDKRLMQMAYRLAKRTRREIVYMGLFVNRYRGVETVADAGVEEFLSYIKNADFVITNSFHGTVFSVLFEKRFLSVKIASTSSRAENVLGFLGLSDRLISSVDDVERASLPIDFKKANTALQEKRTSSIEYLTEVARIAQT